MRRTGVLASVAPTPPQGWGHMNIVPWHSSAADIPERDLLCLVGGLAPSSQGPRGGGSAYLCLFVGRHTSAVRQESQKPHGWWVGSPPHPAPGLVSFSRAAWEGEFAFLTNSLPAAP